VRAEVRLLSLVLIALGVFFLLRNFGLLPLLPPDLVSWWPLLVFGIGLALLVRGLGAGRADGLVAGTILTIYGAFFLLVPLGLLRTGDVGRYWGVFPAAIGAAFLVRYLASPAQTTRLVLPAAVLLLVGLLGLAGSVLHAGWRLWPLILIAVGLLLLFRRA
jgi:LiaF transmembrane domain